jgi:glucokinase
VSSTLWAIGIDIGGTKTAVGLVDREGMIKHHIEFPTRPQDGFAAGVDRLVMAVEDILRQTAVSRELLSGIGIGCPGPLRPNTGTLHNPYTLPGWEGCNLIKPLATQFGLPVRLENDADTAVLGEAFAGAARQARHVVMLTFGTGVGSGILVDGRIYRGVDGEHPEAGHLPIDPNGPECYCGGRGCLEILASGTAIAAAGRGHGYPDGQSVFAAADRGNPQACLIVDGAVQATAKACWMLVHTFLPEYIVLGGGLMDHQFDRFAAPARQALRLATQIPRDRVRICAAQLGNRAGLVGAAALVFER